MDYPALKIASGFPRDVNGNVRNWGNFSDYQTGSNFALYDEDMMADANTFENFLEFALLEGWANKTLQEYFDNPPQTYRNKDKFLTYFLAPYLSIINGYGAALMDQTTFADIDPLFLKIPFLKTPLGSFTKPASAGRDSRKAPNPGCRQCVIWLKTIDRQKYYSTQKSVPSGPTRQPPRLP